MTFLTTDLCDAHSENLQVASPIFKSYGGQPRFYGQIVTLKVFEDNSLVRTTLSEPGEGKVLVVDGGGSLRCALVGDQIAALAVDNHWAGIIVYGCIRDSVAISKLPIGVRALNTHPLKSVKKGVGDRNMILHFADVKFHPNDYVYADEDGVIISPSALW
ncbi:ribonuclease E activity regulator RraA [Leeia sp. TBRC 13508]|uniref:4-hydroxy-4-methyl-2-oxoglutarate aldolase n=1 Tax=Leeia speluncae TaxID=2884804 RepID=A0ABS8D4K6_9NEIS|nr:ribonuclease E activity regulator RraA [Leeia speluncae]MCB6183127.1 ribonuclease E activity regulator RraA [Leeia speluncae]